MGSFNYENTETKMIGGKKIVRKVSIKKGRGYKSITKYHKGKKVYSAKKPIHRHHIELIKNHKFIPGLFKDCVNCKTKKRRGGGKDDDIEMGPSPRTQYMGPVPPDPDRFKKYAELEAAHIRKYPLTSEQAAKFFEQGNPEQKEASERGAMSSEDTLGDINYGEFKIFGSNDKGGRRKRKTRRY
jgi:hypothetical protein